MKIGLNEPLADSNPNNFSETLNFHPNTDIIALKNCKGITQLDVLPLWPTNFFKPLNCHQNLEMVALKKFKGMNSMGLRDPLAYSKTKIPLKHQTFTKTLISLPWSQSTSWWGQVQPHKQHPCHNHPQDCGGGKSMCPILIGSTDHFQSHPSTSFRINERWYIKCNIKSQKSTNLG